MYNSLVKSIKKSFIYDKIKYIFYRYLLPDKFILKRNFKKRLGRKLNLNNPRRFNDKLQWLKLNWSDPVATKYADKFEVRNLIAEEIGAKYLNELYAVYESVDEIDLKKLPESFVLKGTHGSGFNIICENKYKMDWDKQFKKMRKWLKKNYFWQNKENVYRDIKPRIICERFIKQDKGNELRDYRFFCFNGDPKFITVDFSINNKSKTRRNLYDLDWNLMREEISYPKEISLAVEKPKKLDEMINLSRKISKRFPHARVDFYYIEGKIIFGEVTFFHQSGMGKINPIEFEDEMGKWLTLPYVDELKH
ncbi:ATP-grasp fold amidoligase family protein [Halobacillus sp. H74]|uniref:ATP-grasp fold amidoligase family protein n=1 Tax=Halobacillus sp. H74 TaxID=3457436 RepID=UPI003FCC6756